VLTRTTGLFWHEHGWQQACCYHDSVVRSFDIEQSACSTELTQQQQTHPLFIPAPVDLHIHGAGGHDCMQGSEAIVGMLRSAAEHGTGALLATSMAAPFEQVSAFLQDVKQIQQNPPTASAELLGAHLEGPFINPDKLGAQPPYAVAPDKQQLEAWLRTGVVKVVTFAPEMDVDLCVVDLCNRFGARPQIGHTLCSWQQAQRVLQAGCGVTHLYNAMSGVAARDGGALVAALAYAEHAEIITDGIHVERAAFMAAKRAIPELYSVTDATAAAGMPDGVYQLGGHQVIKHDSTVRLANGTLAGSCLTQLRSIEVLRDWGLDWHELANLISVRPANWIGAHGFGQLEVGKIVNWLEIQAGKVSALWLAGQRRAFDEQ